MTDLEAIQARLEAIAPQALQVITSEPNAAFIANAPGDIASLLSLVRRLREALNEIAYPSLAGLDAKDAAIARAREALEEVP